MIIIMTDIEEERRKLEEAQFQMIEAYLDKIKTNYTSLPERKRQELMRGLEGITYGLFPINSSESIQQVIGVFNPEKARQVRIGVGINQRELAKQLGAIASNLCRYERGKTIPGMDQPVGKTYLLWLKQQGYNPYNI